MSEIKREDIAGTVTPEKIVDILLHLLGAYHDLGAIDDVPRVAVVRGCSAF